MIFVTGAFWERIYLHIDVETDDPAFFHAGPRFFLIGKNGLVETEWNVTPLAPNRLRLMINVTNSGINSCIQNGNYKIIGEAELPAETDSSEETVVYKRELAKYFGKSEQLAEWSRCFNYWDNVGTYTVSFMTDENTEESDIQLLFYNAKVQKVPKVTPRQPPVKKKKKKEPLKKRISNSIKKFLKKRQGKAYRFFRKHRSKEKKRILFLSEQDDKLALNMQALYNRMKERGLDREFEIEFSLRRATSKDYSYWSSIKRTWKIARADVILVDDHVPLFDKLVLDKSTTLIQIWHAGAGFKGVGYSRWGHYGCPGPFNCHRQYTYCISGSRHISKFFSEQFGILDEQVIPTGMPRMDSYMDQENRKKVTERLYEAYPDLVGKTVILFAPTYRGRGRRTAHYPYELIDFEALYQFCCEQNAVVLFKMHPWVNGAVPIADTYKDRFMDFNSYPDINELFYITDLLITDYSSSMYEFLLMKKPMLFFAFDKNQFASSRGFHRDYDSNVPGKICETFDEIMTALRNHDFEFEKVEQAVGEYFDNVDTHNCDRVIDWLILDHMPEEFSKALQSKRAEVAVVRNRKLTPTSEVYSDKENPTDEYSKMTPAP